jgi:predicted porin
MKHNLTMARIAFAMAALASAPVSAQSSVTLYGSVDNGIGYQTSHTSLGVGATALRGHGRL